MPRFLCKLNVAHYESGMKRVKRSEMKKPKLKGIFLYCSK